MVYQSDPNKIKPEDFVVVSVQRQCVWSEPSTIRNSTAVGRSDDTRPRELRADDNIFFS